MKEVDEYLEVGLVVRRPAIFEQRIFVSHPHCGLLINAIPPPGLALIVAIFKFFDCRSIRLRNVLDASHVVIIYLDAFSTNACDVISKIICIEDICVDFLSFVVRNGRSSSTICLQGSVPDAIGVSLMPHDSVLLCCIQLNVREEGACEKIASYNNLPQVMFACLTIHALMWGRVEDALRFSCRVEVPDMKRASGALTDAKGVVLYL